MGFALADMVRANQSGAAFGQAQCPDQGIGKAGRFVGDNAPGNGAGLEAGQQCVHALEQGGFLGHARFVEVQEGSMPFLIVRMIRFYPETDLDHGAGAVRDGAADVRRWQGRQAMPLAQLVEAADEVRGRVDQRAIEIEQHGRRAAVIGRHGHPGRASDSSRRHPGPACRNG